MGLSRLTGTAATDVAVAPSVANVVVEVDVVEAIDEAGIDVAVEVDVPVVVDSVAVVDTGTAEQLSIWKSKHHTSVAPSTIITDAGIALVYLFIGDVIHNSYLSWCYQCDHN